MKFEERLPFEKVAAQMESQFGLPMTAASAFEITRRVSDYLRPQYNTILANVQNSRIVNVDETGVKVDGKRYWLWTFVTKTDMFYVIRKSRGKKVLDEVLGRDFGGYLGCDGWKSYANFTGKLQRCWAHLLREAEWVSENCDEAGALYSALKRLFDDLTGALVGDPPLAIRKGLVAMGKRRLRYWLNKHYESVEAKRFIQKVSNGYDHWFNFVLVAGLEPTNNLAERALKEPVVQRKIMGTLRNEKGTQIYETMMTLLATWKQHGLNRYDKMSESLKATWSKS